MDKLYKGVVVPAITPLTQDLTIDRSAAEKLLTYLRQNEVIPFVLGTTGETPSLPASVKAEYIEIAGKLKRQGEQLYAGVSSNCLSDAIELSEYSFEHGVDVVVAHLPAYYKLSESQIFSYFKTLAQSIPGPLMIYNMPATTGMSIPLNVADQLSHYDNIVGIKDSERDDERLKKSRELWSARPDFSHFVGWAGRSEQAILGGSDGIVPSSGNLLPDIYAKLYLYAKQGFEEEAGKLQGVSDKLGAIYQKDRLLGESLAALKSLMQQLNLCEPYMMPPLNEVSENDKEKLISDLRKMANEEGINLNEKVS